MGFMNIRILTYRVESVVMLPISGGRVPTIDASVKVLHDDAHLHRLEKYGHKVRFRRIK